MFRDVKFSRKSSLNILLFKRIRIWLKTLTYPSWEDCSCQNCSIHYLGTQLSLAFPARSVFCNDQHDLPLLAGFDPGMLFGQV